MANDFFALSLGQSSYIFELHPPHSAEFYIYVSYFEISYNLEFRVHPLRHF